jgi:hypothetical protein
MTKKVKSSDSNSKKLIIGCRKASSIGDYDYDVQHLGVKVKKKKGITMHWAHFSSLFSAIFFLITY